MEEARLFEMLYRYGVVPVIVVESPDLAIPLADALIAGGLPVAEITFRTAAAAEVIATLRKERPEMIVGAGTILTLEHLRLAKECGAQFGVSPGLNPEIVEEARRLNLPFIPGILTPSEIERALGLGAKVLKFFPAEESGGPAMIQALAGPYRHTGVKFMPTGGINLHNLESYLKLDIVLMVGGTWLARKETIAAQEWETIQANCREARAIVAQIRGDK
ncbi:MAG: bifunctional 4-hydroxy-2-oxoglutarate aldolase/2-dehydro-3-deoxy-phosphogluconate aldolase [Anaerolineae bacterium]|nr:bifunctional 4-hydroxy-2-oxoglutarate aldolase/2-dehydro-3-deoxy-phosphogluconate aldolase [Anaerolineae bacterium]